MYFRVVLVGGRGGGCDRGRDGLTICQIATRRECVLMIATIGRMLVTQIISANEPEDIGQSATCEQSSFGVPSATQPYLYRVGPVDVFSWDPVRAAEGEKFGRTTRNFGDVLGRYLVERIVDRRGLIDGSPPASDELTRRLFAVGSILHFASQGATVWGAGVNFKMRRRLNSFAATLDVRAVRGPVSARVLERAGCQVQRVFGDPILLLPYFLPEATQWRVLRGDDVLVVPNLNDLAFMSDRANALGLRVLDPTGPTEHLLKRIATAGLVIGSSLHAVVVADSIGVPARLVKSGSEHVLKYKDYLAGSGRSSTRIATTLEEALAMGPHREPMFSAEALLDSFPFDLWSDSEELGQLVDPDREQRADLALWDPLIDTHGSEEPAAVSSAAMASALDHLCGVAADKLQDGADLSSRDPRSAIGVAFANARRVRETAGSLAEPARLTTRNADLMAAVDLDHQGLAERAAWLHAVGPHALGRLVTGGFTSESILFLSLRVGTLTNSLSEWRLCRDSDAEVEVLAELPLFAVSRQQWSIEASIPLGDVDSRYLAELIVQFKNGDGDWATLPVTPSDQYGDLTGREAKPAHAKDPH